MDFMVIDTNGYNVLLGLNFFNQFRAIIYIEWWFIQVHHCLNANVWVLPLNMINMLQQVENLGLVTMAKVYKRKAESEVQKSHFMFLKV